MVRMFGFKWCIIVIGHVVFCLIMTFSPCLGHNGSTVSTLTSSSDECSCGPRPCSLDSIPVCPWNRTIPQTDCPCCAVPLLCARQANQTCDHRVLLCDEQLGLECDNRTNTCSGPFNLHAMDVTHNSTVLRWTVPNGDDAVSNMSVSIGKHSDGNTESEWTTFAHSDISTGRMTVDGLSPDAVLFLKLTDWLGNAETVIVQTKVGCIENGTSFGIGERYDIGCDKRCECSERGLAECFDMCKSRRTGSSCREMGPDPTHSCCTLFVCDGETEFAADGRAHVILTGRTPDSLTFAWDDFKVPGPNFEYGYVVEYRHYSSDNTSISSWNKIQVGDVPITTVRNLRPNSPYEVRVSIWEDIASKRLGPSAEVTILYTEDGCIWNNRSVAVGDVYDQDCVARCFCLGNNTSECGNRCTYPYQLKGATDARSNCTEKIAENDSCCVLVECSRNHSLSLNSHARQMNDRDGDRKDGECPVMVTDSTGECHSTCKSDKECQNGEKCCLAECGSTVCVPSVFSVRTEVKDECADVRCGPNAHCRTFQKVAQCHCLPGYTEMPSQGNASCEPILHLSAKMKTVKAGCIFGNATYLVGESFNNGCEYVCRCNNNEGKYEMSCQPRCSHKEDKSRLFDPLCQLVRDPDDECCKVLVCEATSENDAERTSDPGKNSSRKMSGCVYNGKVYEKEQHFYDGCESSCRCLSMGKVACNPRCPTQAPVTPGCVSTPSPRDEECCTIVTCDSTMNTTTDGFLHFGEENTTVSNDEFDFRNASHFDVRNDTESGAMNVLNETSEFQSNAPSLEMNSTYTYAIGERSALGNDTVSLVEDDTLKRLKDNSNNTVFARGAIFENVTDDVDRENDTSTEVITTSLVAPTNESKGEQQPLEGGSESERDSRFEGRQSAAIYKILPINPTTVRLQIIMSPSIMEKMFMDGDAVAVLYTSNLTTDLNHWDRHPLALQHNVAFVSVDRSDVAVETIVTELLPNREYYFVVVMLNEGSDPDKGLQYEKLGEVQATITVQLEESVCEFMGKTFRMGERLYDDCQAMCDCLPGRHVHCEAIICPNHLSPEKSGCLEWYVDQTFIPRAPHCCPDVTCKYGSMCVFEGHKFRNLETIPRHLVDECDQECKCVAGNVTCTPRCPPLASDPPSDLGCKPNLSLIDGDDCCLHWFCEKDVENETVSVLPDVPTPFLSPASIGAVESENVTSVVTNLTANMSTATGLYNETTHSPEKNDSTNTATEANLLLLQSECVYENETYKVNDQWRVGKGHRQKTCTCILLQNGSSSVECQGGCPPILKQHLGLIPDCPPENVVVWDVPDLCPYVVCNKTDVGRGVKNVTVEPLNSTSVRVSFVIPNIYVGLYGHIEILYTMDLTHSEDTTTWNKEVFSGPSNQFENARLVHEMNGLQPDTEYYLKVHVIIKNTKNMETSDIFTVHTPPLPTTASTVVTTTLPPKIFIDPRLNISDVQPMSAKISWRSFEETEKRFIDGVQLQYRPETDSSIQQWSQTVLIHRDVTTYVLDHLKPDSNYDAVLIFVPPVNVSTEVLSEKTVSFRTLPMRDDFEFNLTLTVDKVAVHTVDLIWTGVPYPEQKYVNVYRILYVELSNRSGLELYRAPKGNQFQFTVDGLTSETNYTVWMEVYLINGKVRASNNVTFVTKVGSPISKTTEKEKLEAVGEMERSYANASVAGPTYYAAMIVAAVVATLSSIGFVILLVVLLRKHPSAKAPITSTKSHSAYDNPTYKDSLE